MLKENIKKEFKNCCGIYCIKSLIDDRLYIGSTINFKTRYYIHRGDLKRNEHHSPYLQNFYNKYGAENLMFQIILLCNEENLIKEEQKLIDFYGDLCFNCMKIVDRKVGFFKGRTHSEETKKKLRKWSSERRHTEETKLKMSESHKGRIFSQETRNKISTKNKGLKRTKEQNEANALRSLGKKHSTESIRNMSGRSQAGFTEDDIRFIRKCKSDKSFKIKELAKMFNVSTRTIHSIVSKEHWKHVV